VTPSRIHYQQGQKSFGGGAWSPKSVSDWLASVPDVPVKLQNDPVLYPREHAQAFGVEIETPNA